MKAGGPVLSTATNATSNGQFRINGETTDRTATSYDVTGSGYAKGKSSGGTTYNASYNVDGGFAIIHTTSPGTGTDNNILPTFIGTPDVIIAKQVNATNHWFVYHKDATTTGDPARRQILYFNLDEPDDGGSAVNGFGAVSTIGDNSGRTWALGNNNATNNNGSGNNYVYYLFKSVAGVSKYGTYTGAGSGVTVTTGFKPRFVMVKNININGRQWVIKDTFRETTDTTTINLYANLNNADDAHSTHKMIITSTGFEFDTNSTYTSINENGEPFVYFAWA